MSIYGASGTLLATGTTTYGSGSGSEEWLTSDLNYTFVSGREYVVSFYTNQATSATFRRKDSPNFAYGVGGAIQVIRSLSTGYGNNAQEELPTSTNTWAPFQKLFVVQ